MTFEEFEQSLTRSAYPDNITEPLQALWTDANGDWDGAHRIVQSLTDADSAWVHAYLHRKEGDLSNASYWYHRAGKPMPEMTLAEEWQSISHSLLTESQNLSAQR